jgi:hypothetical protein
MDKNAPIVSSYAQTVINRERAIRLDLEGLTIWFSDDLPMGFQSAGDETPTVCMIAQAIPAKHARWIDGGGARVLRRRLPYRRFQEVFASAFAAWRASGPNSDSSGPVEEIQNSASE